MAAAAICSFCKTMNFKRSPWVVSNEIQHTNFPSMCHEPPWYSNWVSVRWIIANWKYSVNHHGRIPSLDPISSPLSTCRTKASRNAHGIDPIPALQSIIQCSSWPGSNGFESKGHMAPSMWPDFEAGRCGQLGQIVYSQKIIIFIFIGQQITCFKPIKYT